MANKGFGAEKINLIGGGVPTVSSPNDLNLNADNVAISTNASLGGNLSVNGSISAASGIVTSAGFYGPIYIEESSDENTYYDIPFLNSTGAGNNYRQLQIDYGQLMFNASDNTLRLYGGMNATGGFAIGIQSAGSNIVTQGSQYLEGINFAGTGNNITYNSSSRFVTVEIAGGSGAGVGTDTSINTTGIITAAAFNSPYYNSGVPYIGVGAGATQIEFQAANVAITTDMTVGGAINAAGAVFSGIATGTFVGDGSGLTGLVAAGSGVQVKDSGTLVGMAQTIDFGTDLDVSNISAGIVTVTNAINLAGIDTAGVSVFNNIDAAGIVTAASFDTDGTGSPVISSGVHTTITLNSPTVAISTNMTVGGNLTVTGTINGSNLGGTLSPDGINMMGQKYITFYKDNSTALSSHNSEMYGTSSGTTIWRELTNGSGDGIRIGTNELTIENQSLYGYMAKFTAGGPVWLSWGGHTGDGNEHKQKLATSGIGVSVLYDYQTLGHMDVRDINATGVVTATSFSGDGSGLTGVTATGSGIVVRDSGSVVGTAATVDFGTNLSVSAVSAGVVTVTASGSGGGNTAGIDTSGVSHFNHINAVGVITANSFTSSAGGASSIRSPGNLTISAPHVGFTTAVSIGGTASIGDTLTMFDEELRIFKNSSSGNIVIQEQGGGSLNINANDLQLKDYLGQENKARFITNGAVELYYDNSLKFETTGFGVTVFGSVMISSGLDCGDTNISGDLNVTGDVTATKFAGDGSLLTGIVAAGSGVFVQDGGTNVGTAGTIDFGSNLNLSSISAGVVTVTASTSGLSDIVQDTSPQLGGNLDLNGKDINGSGDINIAGEVGGGGLSIGGNSTLTGNVNIATGKLTVGTAVTITNAGIASFSGAVSAPSFTGELRGDGSNIVGITTSQIVGYSGGGGGGSTPGINTTGTSYFNNLEVAGNVELEDDSELRLGTDNDTTITHSGTNTIMNVNGNYFFQGNTFYVQNQAGTKNYIRAYPLTDGRVELYHDNNKKWETTGYGSTVFGTGTASAGFTVYPTAGDGSDRGFSTKYYITSSGSSGYRFAGPGVLNSTNNPTLYFHRGFTYILENATGNGHPFALRVSTNGSAYNPGGNFLTGAQNGTQILTVPFDAPNSIVYQCTLHSSMVGTINFPT